MSCVKDEIGATNPGQRKVELMAVMDKIGGSHEEGERIEGDERHEGSQIGGRLAGWIWIFSKNTDMQ